MSGAADPLPSTAELPAWTRRVDLAASRLGGRVLWANDEFFAEKENLLLPAAPVWREHEYTDRGKWMDGWETRRRRVPGHDSCIIRLGLPGILRGVVVDTAFFRGNFPERCSLEACAVDGDPSVAELQAPGTEWLEVLPEVALRGDARNPFAIDSPYRFTHLRFHIYPDGGVARLRVHGEVMPDWPAILARGEEIDLVAVQHGGRWLAASDLFFSAPQNLLMPGRGAGMHDGWETRRRRGPGFDWVVLQLGIAGTPRRVLVDTAHFKGNYPDSCALELSATDEPRTDGWEALPWQEVLSRQKLQADSEHHFALTGELAASHARFSIHPDGGVSRLRLLGAPSREGRLEAGRRRLNAMLPRQATASLLACCGAPAWAEAMAARRPFASLDAALAAADQEWGALPPEQWRAAFGAHPEIGGRHAAGGQPAAAAGWSAQEQAGVREAAEQTRIDLAEANATYRERFGHIFIVCATGKSAEQMLALCRERLANDPSSELRVAAEEQRQITRLRLAKLLSL